MSDPGRQRILVIKLGALGDLVQAFGPFQAIRDHHGSAHITLLTTAPVAALAEASSWFDDVWIDNRPGWWQPGGWLALAARLKAAEFARVYDLQTSGRSNLYYQIMGSPKPEWSGIAAGCSHPHANPGRDDMHTVERQAEQLRMAGIEPIPAPDLDWFDATIDSFGLDGPFVLLAPGGALHRPEKRWPGYAELARRLAAKDMRPVLLGTAEEASVTAEIAAECATALDLTDKTSLFHVAGLARRAAAAVGNDTGPMHVTAALGCSSLVLFSLASDPALCAQRGPAVEILRRDDLATLGADEVEAALRLR
ncbi:MAG: glycosyltransferase family 9 protein [Alphaproteobacteria bacterium]|nr:glycosyltransferase family 9 protein [Alphaproteobacteria bacterium]